MTFYNNLYKVQERKTDPVDGLWSRVLTRTIDQRGEEEKKRELGKVCVIGFTMVISYPIEYSGGGSGRSGITNTRTVRKRKANFILSPRNGTGCPRGTGKVERF